MKHKKNTLLICIFFSFTINISAQDISGLWKGKIYWKGLERDTITAYFEIRKGVKPNTYTGISTCINDKPGNQYWYGRASFICTYNTATKKYFVAEDSLLESSSRGYPDKYTLAYVPAKKQLKGKVECDPKGPNGFECDDTRIIELWRTSETPPIMKKQEKMRVRIGFFTLPAFGKADTETQSRHNNPIFYYFLLN